VTPSVELSFNPFLTFFNAPSFLGAISTEHNTQRATNLKVIQFAKCSMRGYQPRFFWLGWSQLCSLSYTYKNLAKVLENIFLFLSVQSAMMFCMWGIGMKSTKLTAYVVALWSLWERNIIEISHSNFMT
jgi:hypothetical protein